MHRSLVRIGGIRDQMSYMRSGCQTHPVQLISPRFLPSVYAILGDQVRIEGRRRLSDRILLEFSEATAGDTASPQLFAPQTLIRVLVIAPWTQLPAASTTRIRRRHGRDNGRYVHSRTRGPVEATLSSGSLPAPERGERRGLNPSKRQQHIDSRTRRNIFEHSW